MIKCKGAGVNQSIVSFDEKKITNYNDQIPDIKCSNLNLDNSKFEIGNSTQAHKSPLDLQKFHSEEEIKFQDSFVQNLKSEKKFYDVIEETYNPDSLKITHKQLSAFKLNEQLW